MAGSSSTHVQAILPPSLPPLTPTLVLSLSLPPSDVLLVPPVLAAREGFLEVFPCPAQRLQEYLLAGVGLLVCGGRRARLSGAGKAS